MNFTRVTKSDLNSFTFFYKSFKSFVLGLVVEAPVKYYFNYLAFLAKLYMPDFIYVPILPIVYEIIDINVIIEVICFPITEVIFPSNK